MIGSTLGHCRIVEKVGAGGMGVVYRARDERLERDVALKVLPANSLADETTRRQFQKEARALARLNHPNIAGVYEFDSDQGIDFIVMEYVPGVMLAEMIAAAPGGLPEKQVLDFGRQLAEGLTAAHAQGVIHRDLKPANIRITPEGRLKILDFGLAMMLRPGAAAEETLTASERGPGLVGTLAYMAPEQIRGEVVDARTDIFASGIVLYEMSTGRRPFSGGQTSQVIQAILGPPPESPRTFSQKTSPTLENIILKTLEKDPGRRFQSAKELAIDLERLAHPTESHTARAARIPPWHGLLSSVRVHPFFFTFSGLAMSALILLLWWTLGARPVLSFSPRDFVLISDFDNQTGEALFDRSLLTALSVSIEQSAHVNMLPPARVVESLKRMARSPGDRIDESTGRQICIREGVRALVVPSIARAGSQYALSARLVNPQTGIAAWSYIETARSQEEILPALGRLATQVRRGLGESWLATLKQNRPLPLVTTASLSALKMYADGQDLWNKGQYSQAMGLWQSAVQADPNFAMAHAAIGGALYSYINNDPAGGKEHYERALALSERTTDRERLGILVDFASSQNHFPEALQLFQQYLQEYPDDIGMRSNLARLLRVNGRCSEAIEQYQEVLRLYSRDAASLIDIATCYSGLGNLTEALRNYDLGFQVEPSLKNNAVLDHEYGMALVRAGQEEKARAVFRDLLTNPDLHSRALRSIAYLDLYHGRYRAAKAGLEEALLENKARNLALSVAREHCLLAQVYEGTGDNTARLRELDQALQIYPSLSDKVMSGTWLVRGYARAGQVEKAAQVLEVMKKQADMNNMEQASLVNFSEAEVELLRGNRPHAIELLLLADHQKRDPYVLDGLSRAYEASGDTEQATLWSKTLVDMQPLGVEAQQDGLAARVRLAGLDLTGGKKDEAKAILDQFLDLWKDADPGVSILKEARAEHTKLE